jgi:hypothetical protein
MLLGSARVRFSALKPSTDSSQDVAYVTSVTDQPLPVDWEAGREAGFAIADLEKAAAPGVSFAVLPPAAGQAKSYTVWSREFVTWLYGSQQLELLQSPGTGQVSRPGESERDFRIRLAETSREQRDLAAEKLRQKYAPKIATLQERLRRAQQSVEREAAQAKQAGLQTAISVGATLLEAFTGRKKASRSTFGKATTAFRGAGRSMQQQSDVGRAKETVQAIQQQLDELDAAFKEEMAAMQSRVDPQTETLGTVVIKPKKTDIAVQLVSLVWAPCRENTQGGWDPAW